MREITKRDIGKEFEVKFLPNVDDLNFKIDDCVGCGESTYCSCALVNGEYVLYRYSRVFYEIIQKLMMNVPIYISKRSGIIYDSIDQIDEYELGVDEYRTIMFNEPYNIFNINDNYVLKFKVGLKEGFLNYENIRLVLSENDPIWDGTFEGQESVKNFLNNKTWKLERGVLSKHLRVKMDQIKRDKKLDKLIN